MHLPRSICGIKTHFMVAQRLPKPLDCKSIPNGAEKVGPGLFAIA